MIYFFKNGDYYRFNPEERPPVKDSYPKPIQNWEGVPDNIDDALKYKNGYTYFFKDGQYWRFDDRAFKVDKANPSFPRDAGVWWFGCASRPRGRLKRSLENADSGTTCSCTKSNDLNGGGQQQPFGSVSGRSDVPPRFHPDVDQGDDSRGFDVSSFWNMIARPFRGLFIPRD